MIPVESGDDEREVEIVGIDGEKPRWMASARVVDRAYAGMASELDRSRLVEVVRVGIH